MLLFTLIFVLQTEVRNVGLSLLPFLQHDLGSWSSWGKFVRQRQQIDKLLYAEIAERRQQNDLAAKDEQGEPLSNRELMTMLFAGHDNHETSPRRSYRYTELKITN